MSSAQKPASTPSRAEELLSALEGVVSAHVVADPGGRIVEIHVLATPDLHPKQVVRNVESALSAGLGIGIDRRVVSVAQMRSAERSEGGDGRTEGRSEGRSPGASNGPSGGGSGQVVALAPSAPGSSSETAREGDAEAGERSERAWSEPPSGEAADARESPRRLEYVRYEARRDVESCTVEVVLRDGAVELTGRGAGPDTAAGRAEAAARAVIEGIGRARPELRLALEGAVLTQSRSRSFVIISAHAVLERATIALAGAAAVSRSPEEAAILAALQATNRWSG